MKLIKKNLLPKKYADKSYRVNENIEYGSFSNKFEQIRTNKP